MPFSWKNSGKTSWGWKLKSHYLQGFLCISGGDSQNSEPSTFWTINSITGFAWVFLHVHLLLWKVEVSLIHLQVNWFNTTQLQSGTSAKPQVTNQWEADAATYVIFGDVSLVKNHQPRLFTHPWYPKKIWMEMVKTYNFAMEDVVHHPIETTYIEKGCVEYQWLIHGNVIQATTINQKCLEIGIFMHSSSTTTTTTTTTFYSTILFFPLPTASRILDLWESSRSN